MRAAFFAAAFLVVLFLAADFFVVVFLAVDFLAGFGLGSVVGVVPGLVDGPPSVGVTPGSAGGVVPAGMPPECGPSGMSGSVGTWPAPGVLGTPLADATLAAAAAVYGEPVVYPQLPGAGPARVMLDVLGATTVSPAGTTRLESGLHAPNEHGPVEDYLDHVRFSLRLLEELSRRGS